MAAKDQALELLAQGISASQVAQTLGVSESYISQLMSDEDFAGQLSEVKVKQASEDSEYDKKLDEVEAGFLERIELRMPMANLQQSMQGFKLLNSAKRRRDSAAQHAQVQIGTLVNIVLPAAIVPKYVLNQQSEIVEVEGQTMISATPKGLEGMLAKKNGKSVEEVQRQLQSKQSLRASEVLDEAARPVKRLTRAIPDHMIVDLL